MRLMKALGAPPVVGTAVESCEAGVPVETFPVESAVAAGFVAEGMVAGAATGAVDFIAVS